jgi:hypothetical protein
VPRRYHSPIVEDIPESLVVDAQRDPGLDGRL